MLISRSWDCPITLCATLPGWLRQEPATTVTASSVPSNRNLIERFKA
jgi:hypothetical protein